MSTVGRRRSYDSSRSPTTAISGKWLSRHLSFLSGLLLISVEAAQERFLSKSVKLRRQQVQYEAET